MSKPIDLDCRRQLQDKLLDHLEAAQAITDELNEPIAGYWWKGLLMPRGLFGRIGLMASIRGR